MKVLTIKQPYLDLILEGHKKVEIRSWRTKYRGELYLHSAIKSDTKALEKYKSSLLTPSITGTILCKCQLLDCIILTKDVIDTLNENNKVYQMGYDYMDYYGWVLTNIVKIKPIITKGKLSIWEY